MKSKYPLFTGIYIYTRQKKKRNTMIFPIKLSFLYENVNCHKIFISDQILLRLKCGVDEYLYLPWVGQTQARQMINEFCKRLFNATVDMDF